jgi:site-specific DNA-methyltransferase (adenine-specific)
MKNGSWDDVEQVDPPVLLRGDCLTLLKRVRDHSVRAAIFDPPYGTTFLHWDEVIDFDSLWAELNRVLLPDGVAVIFAAHPFTNKVISSNERNFKYQWIWKKTRATGFLHVRRSQPLRIYEDILVFYKRLGVYHPQLIPLDEPRWSRPAGSSKMYKAIRTNKGPPKAKLVHERFPTNILEFRHDRPQLQHTQKPVALLRYLVRTYSNPGEWIIDPCMGSGSLAVAAIREGRRVLGIEKNPKHFAVAERRFWDDAGDMNMEMILANPELDPDGLVASRFYIDAKDGKLKERTPGGGPFPR